ncbi:unnamed protein product [Moneuplotes crassus]|uniref:Centrosomal protein CEP104 N-terminal domain-containing protein n=1 Tax=Euplotes crassus TaxID=5936 RepID=A0AAD2DCE4_EUPCR|nr:unnamed protein product [Moneuplotes crassus]
MNASQPNGTEVSSILNFRIFNVSSQDHEFPAQDLISLVSTTKHNGWQSQRFCTYPQELILQFEQTVHLTQVQFLMHETKIPTLIELFISSPKNEALMSSADYSRLGHFTLTDSSTNNCLEKEKYKSRELKSVFLDHNCKYLKICLEKPYFSKHNPFNQVGIASIVCHGYGVTTYEEDPSYGNFTPVPNLNQSYPAQDQDNQSLLQNKSPEEEITDPALRSKLEPLIYKKQECVQREDFDQAKYLKEIMDKITALDFQKNQSVAAEDYDTAKMIKYQIENLINQTLTGESLEQFQTETNLIQTPPPRYLGDIEEMEGEEDETMYQPSIATSKRERPIQPAAPDLYSGNYDFEALEKERLEEEERRKMIKQEINTTNEESKMPHIQSQINGESFKEGSLANDRIPGHHKINFDDNPEEFARELEENLKEVEDVPADKREMAESLSQIFDEDIIKHILSTKWQQRVKGFEMANGYTLSILQKADDIIAVQNLIFSVIEEGLMDKIHHVNLKAMKMCETYISAKVSQNSKPINEIKNFENIIVLLFDKLAVAKMTKAAEECIIQIINSEFVNLDSFIDFMFDPTSFMEEKTKGSYIHLTPRFKIAQTVINNIRMLESSGRTKISSLPLLNLEDCIAGSTSVNSKEYRELLKQVILDLYNAFGFRHIEDFIHKVDVKFLEQVSDPKKTPEIHDYLQHVDGVPE